MNKNTDDEVLASTAECLNEKIKEIEKLREELRKSNEKIKAARIADRSNNRNSKSQSAEVHSRNEQRMMNETGTVPNRSEQTATRPTNINGQRTSPWSTSNVVRAAQSRST